MGCQTMIPAQKDDAFELITALPPAYQAALQDMPRDTLIEIVMDLGRSPQARYPGEALNLLETPVTHDDLNHVLALLGEFSADNRAGIERTLHRISAIRNRKQQVIGLTLRVGRAVEGTVDMIRDLVESGKSLLLVGRPGVGKTTKLREIARIMADDLGKRVMVIDTSNEIAGDGDIPHPAIGSARRMQVPHPDRQHAVMIEAVENHMPEVIIVDEIGTAAETAAARTIAERGVQLVGTAHGNTLENLVANPTLSDLVGGVQTVTLSDEEARARGTQKTVSERKGSPTFDSVVEILERDTLLVHHDTAKAVDTLLRGGKPGGERRQQSESGEIESSQERHALPTTPEAPFRRIKGTVRIHPYALSRDSVERVIRDLRLNARTVIRPEQADLVLALKARADDPRLRELAELHHKPVHLIRKNTTAQIRHTLQQVFLLMDEIDEDEVQDAVREAEAAIRQVHYLGKEIALTPRRPALRRVQHQMVARYQLHAESTGSEPRRHLVIYPD